MTDYCTVISPRKIDLEKLIEHFREAGVSTENRSQSDFVFLSMDAGTLKLSFMNRTVPQDRFSRMSLGMHDYFRRISGADVVGQRTALHSIASARSAIGVAVEPGFDSDGKLEACVFAVAKEVAGCIFNGSDLIDREGRVVLASDGSSELPRP